MHRRDSVIECGTQERWKPTLGRCHERKDVMNQFLKRFLCVFAPLCGKRFRRPRQRMAAKRHEESQKQPGNVSAPWSPLRVFPCLSEAAESECLGPKFPALIARMESVDDSNDDASMNRLVVTAFHQWGIRLSRIADALHDSTGRTNAGPPFQAIDRGGRRQVAGVACSNRVLIRICEPPEWNQRLQPRGFSGRSPWFQSL